MNNGDKLRQMTNEEMAEKQSITANCPPVDLECNVDTTKEQCRKCWLNYLNTEVETTGHEEQKTQPRGHIVSPQQFAKMLENNPMDLPPDFTVKIAGVTLKLSKVD